MYLSMERVWYASCRIIKKIDLKLMCMNTPPAQPMVSFHLSLLGILREHNGTRVALGESVVFVR